MWRVMGFVGVSDLDMARRFYGDVLGLDLVDERPFALSVRLGQAMVRVTAVGAPVVAPYTVLGWEVDDIASTVDELISRGVAFFRVDRLDQDERGVWAAPDGTLVAWFHDPDGNTLSLTQFR